MTTQMLTVFNVLLYLRSILLAACEGALSCTQLEDIHGVGLYTARPFYCCQSFVGFQFQAPSALSLMPVE